MVNASGLRFMSELPFTVQEEIYIGYLYSDFISKYKRYMTKTFGLSGGSTFYHGLSSSFDLKHREFLVNFVKQLEPRVFQQNDKDIIQE